jgi:16S rRNA processing protein RimM
MADLLAVGRIAKVFGVKGEVVIQLLTDSPERFRDLTHLRLGTDPGSTRRIGIRCTSVEPRGVRLRIRGVDDRSAAELLVGQFLFVDERDRIDLPEGRYFVHDIVGLTVEEETGAALGTIQEVMKYPAHDVYVVRRPDGSRVQIPAVPAFVVGIDLSARTMRVRLIEGMTDL